MKNVLISVVLVSLLGAGCVKSPSNTTANNFLEGTNYTQVSEEISDWLSKHYATRDHCDNKTGINYFCVEGELTLLTSYQAEVVRLPEGRHIPGYPEPQEPMEFYAFVLSDEKNRVFRAFVQSFDGLNYTVTTFGPAIDHRKDQDPTFLSTWPIQELQDQAIASGAKLVMIPYPFTSNQLYYQFGEHAENSRLVHVETGISYNGSHALLDSIDANWRTL